MTNIKFNKLLSACYSKPSISAKHVPFFKNPNSQVELACYSKPLQPKLEDKNLLQVKAQLIQPKPKLVFLQKKGSQIPNPNIISYNFLSKAAAKPKINTVYNMNKLVGGAYNNVYK